MTPPLDSFLFTTKIRLCKQFFLLENLKLKQDEEKIIIDSLINIFFFSQYPNIPRICLKIQIHTSLTTKMFSNIQKKKNFSL